MFQKMSAPQLTINYLNSKTIPRTFYIRLSSVLLEVVSSGERIIELNKLFSQAESIRPIYCDQSISEITLLRDLLRTSLEILKTNTHQGTDIPKCFQIPAILFKIDSLSRELVFSIEEYDACTNSEIRKRKSIQSKILRLMGDIDLYISKMKVDYLSAF